MKETDIKGALTKYGLSAKEASVYMYLLRNRDVPAYDISMSTRIPRTTVYNILEDLKSLNIASSWLKNGVKYYSAENPQRLLFLLKQKEDKLKEIMPDILSMYEDGSVYPSTKLYQGKEGVKHVFENILEVTKLRKLQKLYVFSDSNLTNQLPKYFSNWRKRKDKTGAYTYLIVPPGTPKTEDYTSNSHRETRVMPDLFPFEGSLDICGSHLAFFSFKKGELYAITIDSAIISDMLTKLFLYIWETLEVKM